MNVVAPHTQRQTTEQRLIQEALRTAELSGHLNLLSHPNDAKVAFELLGIAPAEVDRMRREVIELRERYWPGIAPQGRDVGNSIQTVLPTHHYKTFSLTGIVVVHPDGTLQYRSRSGPWQNRSDCEGLKFEVLD